MAILKNPKTLFLLLFLVSNVYSFIHFYTNETFLGEVSQFKYNNSESALYILLLILFFYVFFMVFLFRCLSRIKAKSLITSSWDINWKKTQIFWGWLLILIQSAFIIYFSTTDSFGANSTNRESSLLSAVWVIISPDNLFFIYYCVYRDSKLAKYNCFLAILSNVLRGWSSIFIFIFFMELCYRYRNERLRLGILIRFALVLFLCYPIILVSKYAIRDYLAVGHDYLSLFSDNWEYVFTNNDVTGYLNGLVFGLDQFFSRIQIFSNATVLFSIKDQISAYMDTHLVNSFWNEGLYGLIWNRIAGDPAENNLGEIFAYFIDPHSILGSWNSNPSFLAWFFIYPFQFATYLLFVSILCFLTIMIMKKITAEKLASDMIWFMWLILILPGWFASFVLLLNTLLIFYFVTFIKLCRRRKVIRE